MLQHYSVPVTNGYIKLQQKKQTNNSQLRIDRNRLIQGSFFDLNFIYIYDYLNFSVIGCSGGHTLHLRTDNIFIH